MSDNLEDVKFSIFPTKRQQAEMLKYGYGKMDAELRELAEEGGKDAILEYLSRFGFGEDDVSFR